MLNPVESFVYMALTLFLKLHKENNSNGDSDSELYVVYLLEVGSYPEAQL